MTLIEEAERAEKISKAFGEYRDFNPGYIQSINAAIAESVGLSSALREIDRLLEDHGDDLYLIEEDLKLVHDSISFTLADIWLIIGQLGGKDDAPITAADFQRNWRRIIKYSQAGSKEDLAARLDTYKRFLLALCRTLQSKPSGRDDFRALRQNVRKITPKNSRSLKGNAENHAEATKQALAAPTAGALGTKRSYERERELRPLSPTESGSSSPPFAPMPPNNIPSPPTSPANTFSTASHVSSIDQETEHWAVQVFKNIPSWTPLPATDQKTEYHDIPGQPSYGLPSTSFEEVVAMVFPPDPPGLRVGIFYRRRDLRAKIVVQWRDRRGKTCSTCLPLNMLRIYRIGSMLHFCRRLADGQSNLAWLSLRFTTFEPMVLFACTFLSMRAHDGKRSTRPTDDWELNGEICEYAGKIRDNGFSHALRIYRDPASKAIRIQASVRGGEMDSTPVWTAFITHHITSRSWCERIDRNIVNLRELRPYSFSSEYELQKMPNGAYVLHFESKDDAKDFVGRIEELGREYRKARH